MATPAPSPNANPRLPWLRPRITLRLLLALVTLICIWLAIHVQRAKRQKAAVKFHEVRSSRVYYDYMQEGSPQTQAFRSARNRLSTSPVPDWLLRPLGEDFFHSVMEIEVYDCDQLRDLEAFPGLQVVWTIGNGINDQDVEHVARLRTLRQFHVRGGYNLWNRESQSDLTDRALHLLARMPRLEKLTATGSFSADGLAALAKSRSLREVTITGCDESVTPATAELFRVGGCVQHLSLRRWPASVSPGPSPLVAAPAEDDGLIAEW